MEILLHFLSFLQWKVFKKIKVAQIYHHKPQSAGIYLQSPQSESIPRRLIFVRYIQIKFKIVLDFDTGFSLRHTAAQCRAARLCPSRRAFWRNF